MEMEENSSQERGVKGSLTSSPRSKRANRESYMDWESSSSAKTQGDNPGRGNDVFLQPTSCTNLKYDVEKCMECVQSHRGNFKKEERVCRFQLFRKLCYNEDKTAMTVAGFPDWMDYDKNDLALWMPGNPPEELSLKIARHHLENVGEKFCELVKQEKEALVQLGQQKNKQRIYRKTLPNVREMCDVCSTTLFNYHWTCGKCGFAACLSCLKTRNTTPTVSAPPQLRSESIKVKDTFGWLKCHLNVVHSPEDLIITQIVTGKAMDDLWESAHRLSNNLRIPQTCCESLSNITQTIERRSPRYPSIKHSWLCYETLLQLLEPTNPGNVQIFQEQWKQGKPVIISNVTSQLKQSIWSPESFARDFGKDVVEFIDCTTTDVISGLKMKTFWDGFENEKSRLKDEDGQPMMLKIKDWPQGHDFAEMLPKRFADLMKALPLQEYTHRNGVLNLAARLPAIFSKPDLGPKMYIAYGSGLYLDKGTTNLHLDMSDAVNLMVYIGVLKDVDNTEHNKAVMAALEEADCDPVTINRVRVNKEVPGALWHIWKAKDADNIREFLSKMGEKIGVEVERNDDPIHDQTWYLDKDLRKKLKDDYEVTGYTILQCEGDAVFIPPGAPHQVRNLNNCIKIAEDFVSSENVAHCFRLTEEFRNLTETHSNHEDKLQIKNIVYHTVKDVVAVLENARLCKKM